MPLCSMEVEQATTEYLHELSEFEKINLGQTRVLDSMTDIDNSCQSLLAFIGNENIHGLYDFLLNHRSFLSPMACVDVPLLYSPMPFQNASDMLELNFIILYPIRYLQWLLIIYALLGRPSHSKIGHRP